MQTIQAGKFGTRRKAYVQNSKLQFLLSDLTSMDILKQALETLASQDCEATSPSLLHALGQTRQSLFC